MLLENFYLFLPKSGIKGVLGKELLLLKIATKLPCAVIVR